MARAFGDFRRPQAEWDAVVFILFEAKAVPYQKETIRAAAVAVVDLLVRVHFAGRADDEVFGGGLVFLW